MATHFAIKLVENELLENISYFIENIVSIEWLCCLNKIFKWTWCWLRFKKNIVAKVRNRESNLISAVVSVDKLAKTKGLWLLSETRKIFKSKKLCKIKKSIDPFTHKQALLRFKDYLGDSDYREIFKYPSVIPDDIYFKKLFIWESHKMYCIKYVKLSKKFIKNVLNRKR